MDLCQQGEEEGVGGTPSGLAGNWLACWLALFQVQKGALVEETRRSTEYCYLAPFVASHNRRGA